MTAMIEFDRVSIVFGNAPERALPLMDAGARREAILAETGQVLGAHDATLSVAEGELVVLMGLWLSVLLMVIAFWRVDLFAGLLVAPYVVWTSYAFALNLVIWRRNPGAAQMAGA